MAENTAIEWADHTFNPWIGCTRVSTAASGGGGCDNCYAAVSTPARAMKIEWQPGAPRHRTAPSTWQQPKTWNDRHAEFFAQHGRRQRVFCASLADWLDNETPIEWLVDLLDLIRLTPDLDWLLLSKRIGNWRKRLSEAKQHVDGTAHATRDLWLWIKAWLDGEAPANVWLGATVVNQEEADRDIPKLLAVPARVRFLSIEPMLGPIDLTGHLWGKASPCADCPRDADCHCGYQQRGQLELMDGEPALHWVICGGESGPGARPMHPDWARSLRDDCAAAGVPYLFKQWGEWCPRGPESFGYPLVDGVPRVRLTDAGQNGQDLASEGDNHVWMNRAGKKTTGRLLDGVAHDGFPEVSR